MQERLCWGWHNRGLINEVVCEVSLEYKNKVWVQWIILCKFWEISKWIFTEKLKKLNYVDVKKLVKNY